MTIGNLPVDKHPAVVGAGFEGKGLIRIHYLIAAAEADVVIQATNGIEGIGMACGDQQ